MNALRALATLAWVTYALLLLFFAAADTTADRRQRHFEAATGVLLLWAVVFAWWPL